MHVIYIPPSPFLLPQICFVFYSFMEPAILIITNDLSLANFLPVCSGVIIHTYLKFYVFIFQWSYPFGWSTITPNWTCIMEISLLLKTNILFSINDISTFQLPRIKPELFYALCPITTNPLSRPAHSSKSHLLKALIPSCSNNI